MTNGGRSEASPTIVSQRQSARGFTLVELMVTVAIIAVLAMLAAIGYARWTRSAKTGEATSTLGNLKAAQDSFRSETQRFLDCSGTKDLTQHYPAGTPSPSKQSVDLSACGSNLVCASFRRLGLQMDSQVYFVYACSAGPADGTAVNGINGRKWGTATDVWYIVRANGDLDGNGTQSTYESSSFDSTIMVVKGDE